MIGGTTGSRHPSILLELDHHDERYRFERCLQTAHLGACHSLTFDYLTDFKDDLSTPLDVTLAFESNQSQYCNSPRLLRPQRRTIMVISESSEMLRSRRSGASTSQRPASSTRKKVKNEEDYCDGPPDVEDDEPQSKPKGKGRTTTKGSKGKARSGVSEPVGKFGPVEGYPVGTTFKNR